MTFFFSQNPVTKKKMFSLSSCLSICVSPSHLFCICILLSPSLYLSSCTQLTSFPCLVWVFSDWHVFCISHPASVSYPLLVSSAWLLCLSFTLSSNWLTLFFRLSSGWPSVYMERQTFLFPNLYIDTHIHTYIHTHGQSTTIHMHTPEWTHICFHIELSLYIVSQ